ncbi:MAG: superoxide dismutase [Flavobacteriaceae bacterium]|nr:superoxide dismutase [Flavobacteriaceae bacterium]|tara:strand:- start:244 stop:852 length:609 start_codon:yes stop_codon:yes gene_type:complete
MSFTLPSLPYSNDALTPHIDSKTMEIHHGKHHAGYTTKLNAAIEGTELENQSIEDILKNLDMNNSALRNNGGGYYNHCLFWESMSPNGGGLPSGKISDVINSNFESYNSFKTAFSDSAANRFGSGWAWLCVHKGGNLELCSSANQDNPLMPGIGCGGHPILGLDVWEHAYYLNYQNRRPDYINAFFELINWTNVNKLYDLYC